MSTRSQTLLPGETMKLMDVKWWSMLGSLVVLGNVNEKDPYWD